MQKLIADRFVPAADDCDALLEARGQEHDFFHGIAEQGHYGGRKEPTSTRQGTYACAPSGEFLASVNTNDAGEMVAMLERALAKWDALPRERRLRAGDADRRPGRGREIDGDFPEGGLVLRVFTRDLPRDPPLEGEWSRAWNEDFAWLRRSETRELIPEKLEPQAHRAWPDDIARRLARCHLLDVVRGQSEFYPDMSVARARVESVVAKLEGDLVTLELEGETRTEQKGIWPIAGFADMKSPTEHARGVEARLLGRATFDRAHGRFVAFELVALGTRWGATQYNVRADDQGPAPIGWAFTLAGDSPAERVAPAFVWMYGWKREPKRVWR